MTLLLTPRISDVRETRDDRLSKIKDYLNNELDVMLTDVTDETDALEGSYGGTPEDCCSNPYLQVLDLRY